MAKYPAMDAGERSLARLSGAARERGFPAMGDGRTAGELTGWGSQQYVSDESSVTSSAAAAMRPASGGFSVVPPEVPPAAEKYTPLGAMSNFGLVGTVDENGEPVVKPGPGATWTPDAPAATDPIAPGGFGDFMPPTIPSTPPSSPPPSSPPAAAAPASTGSALTIGALLWFLFH